MRETGGAGGAPSEAAGMYAYDGTIETYDIGNDVVDLPRANARLPDRAHVCHTFASGRGTGAATALQGPRPRAASRHTSIFRAC